jgi:hypothetical protein
MSETWEQTLQSVDFKSDNIDNWDSDAKKIAEKNIKYAESLVKDWKISQVEFDRYFINVIDILKRRESELQTLGESTKIQITQVKSELNITPESLKDYPIKTVAQLNWFSWKATFIYENWTINEKWTYKWDFSGWNREWYWEYVWVNWEKYTWEWKKNVMDWVCTYTYKNWDQFKWFFKEWAPFSWVRVNKDNVTISIFSNWKMIEAKSWNIETTISKEDKKIIESATNYINKNYNPDQIKLIQSLLWMDPNWNVSQELILNVKKSQKDWKPGPWFLKEFIWKSFWDYTIVQDKNWKGKIVNNPNQKPDLKNPNQPQKWPETWTKKSEVNEENLYNWLTWYLDFSKSDKFSIDLKNPKFPEWIDKNKITEAKKLIELGQGIDWIDDWRVSFTKEGKVILELNTRWSDLYIESVGWKYIVSWQSDWKFFVNEVDTKTFKEFVKNYDSENTKKILEELWFTTWLTFIWVVCFLLRTWIWVLLPGAASLGLWAYRWYNLYKLYNLSTNSTVEMGEKLKDKPETLKQYLFLTQVGYITWTWADWTYKTRDSLTINESDLNKKYTEIKNNWNLERKYLLLSQLENRWYSPEYIKWEDRYELDFDWLFDDSQIKFEWDKAKIITSWVKWKSFEVSLEKWNGFMIISNINEYMRTSSELLSVQSTSWWDSNNDMNKTRIKELTDKKTNIAKALWIS